MDKRLAASLLFALAAAASQSRIAGAQEPAAPQGPVSYWKFDESSGTTAANAVGAAPAGTYQGGVTPSTNVPPAITYPDSHSLAFNGTDAVVNVPNFGTFTATSVSVWIYRTGSTGGRQSILSFKESGSGGFVLCLNETGAEYPRIYLNQGGWQYKENGVAIPLTTWTHLAATYDNANLRLYINGQEAAPAATVSGNMTEPTAPTGIGARSSLDQHWFPGLIDDARIYSRALTANEVAVLAAGCPIPTNLQATAGAGQISLSWTAPAGPNPNYTYTIKRGTSAGTETMVASGITGTTYADVGIPYGPTYYYVVTAISAAESGASNEASCPYSSVVSAPPGLTVTEAGGTAQFTVSTRIPLANGASLSTTATVTSAAPSAPCLLSTNGGAMSASLPISFTGNGTTTQSQTITVTGVDDFIAANPWAATITFSTTSSSDSNFNGMTIAPITVNQIESDFPGIIVSPTSLSATNGGPPVTFTVQLASKPTADVHLPMTVSIPYEATVAGSGGTTLTFTSSNWNTAQTVTVTPQAVDASTTYITSYEIDFTPVSSADGSYNLYPLPPVPVSEPTSTPPLKKTWNCGLLGVDGLLPLAGLLAWRRRRALRNARAMPAA
jgi:fibronectin type 3 domain-containing protein